MLRIFSAAIVLGAEALASVLLEKLKNGVLTVVLIVATIAVLAVIFEAVPDFIVERSNWGARLFGMRLIGGRRVHGYWYTTIKGAPVRATRQQVAEAPVLGGTVLLVKATRDGFELEGETYMIGTSEWTTWSGVGSTLEANEILFRYVGSEGPDEDIGVGRYTFHTRDSFRGGFYGAGLNIRRTGIRRGEYRTVTGRRCGPECHEHDWRDETRRRRGLLQHLGAQNAGPLAAGGGGVPAGGGAPAGGPAPAGDPASAGEPAPADG